MSSQTICQMLRPPAGCRRHPMCRCGLDGRLAGIHYRTDWQYAHPGRRLSMYFCVWLASARNSVLVEQRCKPQNARSTTHERGPIVCVVNTGSGMLCLGFALIFTPLDLHAARRSRRLEARLTPEPPCLQLSQSLVQLREIMTVGMVRTIWTAWRSIFA
jgi:hypothetical protein